MIAGALLLLCTAPLAAQDGTDSAISAEEQDGLAAALERGDQLYRYDQAAWHTTDALRKDVKNLSKSGIRGWVVVPVEGGLKVTYWKPTAAGYAAVYSGVYDGQKVSQRTRHGEDGPVVSEQEFELIRATQAAVGIAGKFQRCSDRPFNSVTLPSGEENGGIYVYFLSPQVDNASLPMGGHYRVEVVDGKVVNERAFTKSCFAFPLKQPKGGGKLAAMTITHMLDPVPTELHAFAVHSAGLPLYVVTMENDLLWKVDVTDGRADAQIERKMN